MSRRISDTIGSSDATTSRSYNASDSVEERIGNAKRDKSALSQPSDKRTNFHDQRGTVHSYDYDTG